MSRSWKKEKRKLRSKGNLWTIDLPDTWAKNWVKNIITNPEVMAVNKKTLAADVLPILDAAFAPQTKKVYTKLAIDSEIRAFQNSNVRSSTRMGGFFCPFSLIFSRRSTSSFSKIVTKWNSKFSALKLSSVILTSVVFFSAPILPQERPSGTEISNSNSSGTCWFESSPSPKASANCISGKHVFSDMEFFELEVCYAGTDFSIVHGIDGKWFWSLFQKTLSKIMVTIRYLNRVDKKVTNICSLSISGIISQVVKGHSSLRIKNLSRCRYNFPCIKGTTIYSICSCRK